MPNENQTESGDGTPTKSPKKSGQAVQAPRGTIFKMRPGELTIIGVDTDDGPEHPLYDPRIKLPLDEALVKNIMVNGVIEVIKATKEGDRLLVWDGRRRDLHAREAERRLIEQGLATELRVGVLVSQDTQANLFDKGLSANRFRVDDGILSSARSAQKSIDLGGTVESVSVKMGVSDQTVRNWLGLLGLQVKVLAAVEQGRIGATVAMTMIGLSPEEQLKQLAELEKDASEGVKITAAHSKAKVKASKSKAKGDDEPKRTTPKERVERASAILKQYAALAPWPNAVALELIGKLSRAITGRSVESLTKEAAKEAEEALKAKQEKASK